MTTIIVITLLVGYTKGIFVGRNWSKFTTE